MAGVKVTDLNTLGTAASDDVMYIVDTSTNESKQIEVGNIVNLQTAYDNGNTVNTSTVIIDGTNYDFIVGANIATPPSGEWIAIGRNAGDGATGTGIVALGTGAGVNTASTESVYIGSGAAADGSGDNNVAIGLSAGNQNTGSNVVFLGELAGGQNTGDNVVAIGNAAASGNTLSGMFVISPSALPSYADATAAAAAITVALGAQAGDYYLYHDQSDDTIKAVIPV
jgi:hypothetical protein